MTRQKFAIALGAAAALAILAPTAALAGNGKGNNGNGNGNGGSNSSPADPNSNSNGKGNGNSNPNGSGNSNGNGGVVLLGGPCVLTVGSSCLFQGNINLNNKLSEVDDAYNGQTPAPPSLLDLHSLGQGEQDSGFANPHAGTITSDFLVTYYAVMGGGFFRLYEIAPSYTFSWSTAGLLNNGGQEPGVSHVIWIDPPAPKLPPPPPPGVPEPGVWSLLIAGFGFAGAMLRRARRQGVAA